MRRWPGPWARAASPSSSSIAATESPALSQQKLSRRRWIVPGPMPGGHDTPSRARCPAGPARVAAEEQTQKAAPAEPAVCDEFWSPAWSALPGVSASRRLKVGAAEILMEGVVFGESPRWHDGRLWFSDWGANQVIALGIDGSHEVVVTVASFPMCIDFLPDGRLLVVDSAQ